MTRLKGGKKAEHEEFEKLLREVEVELEAVSSRRGGRMDRSQDQDSSPSASALDPPVESLTNNATPSTGSKESVGAE